MIKLIKSILLIAVVLLLLFSTGCTKQPQDKETDEFKEFQRAMSWFCESSFLETEKVVALKKCSHENVYCKSMLGNMYYQMKQYDKAYDFLIESQGVLKGYYGQDWAPSEMALGEMYTYGRGVNEDKEEAKKHFFKCAQTGNKVCISWMISYAKAELLELLKDAQQGTAYHNSTNGVRNRIDYTARDLLYWYTADGYYGLAGVHGDDVAQLERLIIDKKSAQESQSSARELRDSFIMTLSGLHYTYPYCDKNLWRV